MHIYVTSGDLDFYSVGFKGGKVSSLQLFLPGKQTWRGLMPNIDSFFRDIFTVTVDDQMVFEGRLTSVQGRTLSMEGELVTEESTLWNKV